MQKHQYNICQPFKEHRIRIAMLAVFSCPATINLINISVLSIFSMDSWRGKKGNFPKMLHQFLGRMWNYYFPLCVWHFAARTKKESLESLTFSHRYNFMESPSVMCKDFFFPTKTSSHQIWPVGIRNTVLFFKDCQATWQPRLRISSELFRFFSSSDANITGLILSAILMQIVIFRPRCCLLLACSINVDPGGSRLVPVGVRLEKKVNKSNRKMKIEIGRRKKIINQKKKKSLEIESNCMYDYELRCRKLLQAFIIADVLTQPKRCEKSKQECDGERLWLAQFHVSLQPYTALADIWVRDRRVWHTTFPDLLSVLEKLAWKGRWGEWALLSVP